MVVVPRVPLVQRGLMDQWVAGLELGVPKVRLDQLEISEHKDQQDREELELEQLV